MNQLKHLVSGLSEAAENVRLDNDKEVAKRILARCFKPQVDFILDRSRRKSAMCPRRAGKSYAALALMCRTALLRQKAIVKYICLTRGQARDNLWTELKNFSETFELDLKYHETETRATFPNGSTITFAGAETRAEIEKLRGQKYDLVVIDEAKSFAPDNLDYLIKECVWPTLMDNFGTLVMMGTPGNILAGPFFECTSNFDPEDKTDRRKYRPRPWDKKELFKEKKYRWVWSFHAWHTKHNTAMPHIWEGALESKLDEGIPDNDPAWLREWMGQWCPSESLMVYSFSHELNTYDGNLPEGHEWQYLLGLDLGFNDSTAIVVTAFSDTCAEVYQVYEYKEPGLTIDAIEKQVSRVQRKFPDINAMVADTGGLGKTIIESMKEHGFGFEAAQKTDKLDHVELVNSDLRAGRIKLLPDSHLAAEMKLLQWKDKTYKAEAKGTDNHLCDAHLYLIRYAYHHFWEPAVVKPKEGTNEHLQEFIEQEEASMLAQHNRSTNIDSLDNTYGSYSLDGEEWTN